MNCFALLLAVFLFVCMSASNVSGRSVPVQMATTTEKTSSSILDSQTGRRLLLQAPTYAHSYKLCILYVYYILRFKYTLLRKIINTAFKKLAPLARALQRFAGHLALSLSFLCLCFTTFLVQFPP